MQAPTHHPQTAPHPRGGMRVKTGVKAGVTVTQSSSISSTVTQTGPGSQTEHIVRSESNTYP